jgi:hypothetical protein
VFIAASILAISCFVEVASGKENYTSMGNVVRLGDPPCQERITEGIKIKHPNNAGVSLELCFQKEGILKAGNRSEYRWNKVFDDDQSNCACVVSHDLFGLLYQYSDKLGDLSAE